MKPGPDKALDSEDGGAAAPLPEHDAASIDLAELYRSQEPALRHRLAGLGRRADAEDLAQDAFLKTWANRRSLDGTEAGGRAYLHTVAGNLVRDRWRRERRAARGDALLGGDPPSPLPGADTLAVARLEAKLVRAALSHLDAEKRQVLRMRVIEGRSSEETARLTGKTPAAVRQTQRRALVALRGELTALGWAGSAPRPREEES